tara:strand:+ start:670 stop:954 length:285 start_codon:yes stop_codon:yes gene_type:complete
MSKDGNWWRKELGLDEESKKLSKKQKKIKVKDIANIGISVSQLKLWGFLFGVFFLIFIIYQSFGSEYARCVKNGKKDGTFKIEVVKGFCAAMYK